jgi:hypothetical protein
MADAAHDTAHGHMDITDQRETFHGFLAATIWGCGLIAMGVALATLAFAINAGWWAGMIAYVVIGVAVGILFKQGGAWWATLIASTVILGIGGVIVPLVTGFAS